MVGGTMYLGLDNKLLYLWSNDMEFKSIKYFYQLYKKGMNEGNALSAVPEPQVYLLPQVDHLFIHVLSRASEVGSPTNPPWAPGSDKTQGQGSFGLFTGGLAIIAYTKIKKKRRTAHLIRFLLREGEPGTSQYGICS